MVEAKGKNSPTYDVVVVGAGAAGIGMAIVLKDSGIENFVVLDRLFVGASFAAGPAETRFITPSFPTNSIGMLDLNSIAIGVSPAYGLEVEHPTGLDYAEHLQSLVKHYALPIREGVNVKKIAKVDENFLVKTSRGDFSAKHVIWAAGEFQYPQLHPFEGSEYCRHTATIASYDEIEGDDFIVVGGYESGVDAAYHLSYRDKRVRLFDKECPWKDLSSDPSVALSTYSIERMRDDWFEEFVQLFPETPVDSVIRIAEGYRVTVQDGRTFESKHPPLLAGGFEGSHRLVADLFEQRSDGFPELTERDESTVIQGIFLCGPAVRHDNHVFCFIYKYRQRFAVVAHAIATSLGLSTERLERYRQWGMYLDDLSCCGEECISC